MFIIKNILLVSIYFAILLPQSDKVKILDIIVEGNTLFSSKDIKRNAHLYEKMEIQGPEIQQAIKRLWKLNRFSNVQIYINEERIGGYDELVKYFANEAGVTLTQL